MVNFKAILLLGGEGSRFDLEKPKQFHQLSGKKVYLHTLERFIEAGFLNEIILVTHPQYLDVVRSDVKNYTHIKVVQGGTTRQESSWLGLLACKGTDFVVIHDGVRPFVSKEILLKNKELVLLHRAVDTCSPSFDTIVESLDGQKISNIPNRKHYLRGQTPQSFAYELIVEAHEKTGIKNASDDCQLVLAMGHPVFIAEGSENNIKITTQLDLFLAEQLMREPQNLKFEKGQSLKGRLYVVVGGSGGIGSKIALKLTEKGAKVLTLSKSSGEFPVDITKIEEVRAVFNRIEKEFGQIDGLINAAGCLTKKPFVELSLQEIDNELFVNLHGVIYTCRNAPLKEGGHIVNIASSSFTKGRKEMAVYSASKAAVVNFTQGLAEERGNYRINVVVPQRTNTSLRQNNFKDEDLSLLLDPDLVADKVIDLLQTNSITGQIIEVKK